MRGSRGKYMDVCIDIDVDTDIELPGGSGG